MTYKRLQATTAGLLTGDNVLTTNSEALLGLLEMAFNDLATHADALHLMTMNRDNEVTRLAAGKYVIRTPKLPTDPDDELDVDNELCFAVARLLASYMSDKKSSIHFNEARRIIRDYNLKVYEILESIEEKEDGTYDV